MQSLGGVEYSQSQKRWIWPVGAVTVSQSSFHCDRWLVFLVRSAIAIELDEQLP